MTVSMPKVFAPFEPMSVEQLDDLYGVRYAIPDSLWPLLNYLVHELAATKERLARVEVEWE